MEKQFFMSSTTHDWSKFSLKINIYNSVESVYDAWTIPNHLERWFLRSADFVREDKTLREKELHVQTNDTYTWLWHGYADDVYEKGRVLFANGIDKLQFSFTRGAEVTVDIGVSHNETIVLLTQSGMPTDDESKHKIHLGCLEGWTFYLANLKSILEGGVDLRNKNIELKNMINS